MALRDDLRDAAALAALDVLRAMGSTASFDNMNGTPVSIYVEPRSSITTEGDLFGISLDSTSKTFYAPKQTSFPPSSSAEARYGLVTDSTITYPSSGGEVYHVDEIEADSLGAGFVLRCTRRQAKRVT